MAKRQRGIPFFAVTWVVALTAAGCAKASMPVNGADPTGGAGAGGVGGMKGSGGHGGFILTSLPISLDGASAGSTGQAIPSETDGGNCGVTTGDLTRKESDLLLLLDRSSSMAFGIAMTSICHATDTTCTPRWTTMTSALDEVLANAPTGVHWALKFFPTPKTSGACTVSPGADVVFDATPDDIHTAITGTSPESQTPTKAAIDEAVAYYATVNDDRSHNILLATDGEPNCDPGGSSMVTPLAKQHTETAIEDAAAAGLKTYVIGIGPVIPNLNDFAVAGGTNAFYSASSPDKLTDALNAIAAAVVTCSFRLKPLPQDPANVVVQFNGDKKLRAPRDTSHANGWDYTSPTYDGIELYGSWCENVKNQTYNAIAILMGCPNQPVP